MRASHATVPTLTHLKQKIFLWRWVDQSKIEVITDGADSAVLLRHLEQSRGLCLHSAHYLIKQGTDVLTTSPSRIYKCPIHHTFETVLHAAAARVTWNFLASKTRYNGVITTCQLNKKKQDFQQNLA